MGDAERRQDYHEAYKHREDVVSADRGLLAWDTEGEFHAEADQNRSQPERDEQPAQREQDVTQTMNKTVAMATTTVEAISRSMGKLTAARRSLRS